VLCTARLARTAGLLPIKTLLLQDNSILEYAHTHPTCYNSVTKTLCDHHMLSSGVDITALVAISALKKSAQALAGAQKNQFLVRKLNVRFFVRKI
jgi:hypothetical protein